MSLWENTEREQPATPGIKSQEWCETVFVWEGWGEIKIQYSAESQHPLSDSWSWQISFQDCKLEVPTIALSVLEQKVTLEIRDSGGRSCFIHSTEAKYKGKGERPDLCGKCHSGCNLSLCELVPFGGFW